MMFVMGGLGLVAAVTIFIGSPLIVKIILGSDYGPSIIVLQILALLPLITSLSDVLSIQIMLPFSKDNFYALIRVVTASLHILIAILLVPKLYIAGMAVALLVSQAFILVSTFLFLSHWKLSPFNYQVDEEVPRHPARSRT